MRTTLWLRGRYLHVTASWRAGPDRLRPVNGARS
jgi:hypothetical protein